MQSTTVPSRPAHPIADVVLGSDTRNVLLVGLAAWIGTVVGAWATFTALGFQGGVASPSSSFILALGFTAGAAGLLVYGAARTFYRADQAWPTLCGLAVYSLPLVLGVALPYALLGPGRLDIEATTASVLETTPIALALFAVAATPMVRRGIGTLATATVHRLAAYRSPA